VNILVLISVSLVLFALIIAFYLYNRNKIKDIEAELEGSTDGRNQIPRELLKKVKKIEISTRNVVNEVFSGEYHSVFKGRGMEFAEVREYQPGDDVRTIDWNVSARMGHPFVKIFEEERELTVMLLVDVSSSGSFGSTEQLKREFAAELSAVLAFSAIKNNDKVGMIIFSDKIEKFIPPQKGKKHILRIIRELIDFKPERKGTNIAGALQYLSNVIKKRATVFVISDFIDKNYEKAMQIAKHKHDIIALQIYDKGEEQIPNIGFAKMKDAETNEEIWVNTANRQVRKKYAHDRQILLNKMTEIFKKNGIDNAKIRTDEDYIKPLLMLFKQR